MSDLRDQLRSTLGATYTLEHELGGGGMSRVFVAEEIALRRRVVIKVLPHEMAAGVSIDRFKREIALAARLQHPHIVPLLTAGESDGLPYLTMPFVDGESLRARLERGGELPVADGVRLLREVASALAYAHDQGIVHRDIKPDNILLSHGSAMVTDFGVAKALAESTNAEHGGVTSVGVALGTPAYMSPEQAAASQSVDGRADIYAFGVMAYELFAGQTPFAGRSPQALLAAHVTEAPASVAKLRPSLPPALASLIMRCLEKHAADRPQHADEIVNALDAIATGLTPAALAPAASKRARTVAIAACVTAVLVALVWLGWQRVHTSIVPAGANSVVVLPAEVFGPETDQYLADAVPATLSSHLAEIAGLETKVPPTRLEWEALKRDPQKIVRAYAVALYIAPHVYVSGGRLSMTFQLVQGATRTMLWSHNYEGPADTYLAQIRRSANDLQQVLKPDARAVVAPAGGTKSSEAELAFQQGVHFANRYNNLHQQGDFDVALTSLTRALELDPAMADAAGEISILHIFRFEGNFGVAERITAEQWANRAIAIDAQCGLAFTTLAMIELLKPKGDASLMVAHALRQARYAPRNPLVPNVLGIALKASAVLYVAATQEALTLDPFYRAAMGNLAGQLLILNRSAEGLAAIDAHLARDPEQPLESARVNFLVDLGRADEAAATVNRWSQAGPLDPGQRWTRALVLLREKDPGALDSISVLLSLTAAPNLPGQVFAQLLTAPFSLLGRLGQTDAAVRLALLAAGHAQYPSYDWLVSDDRMASVRADPRFAPVLAASKARFLATLKVVDAVRARNELPVYLVQPLKDLHARLGF